MSHEDHLSVDGQAEQSGSTSAVRVRITKGPDQNLVGKIGYLFSFDETESRGYIVTVTETDVRRIRVQDGYEYIEEKS